jgi:biopolymer transport protein ExbD
MAAPAQRPGELIQGINVTPLVDVVLVLLIILMVTAVHAVSRALPLELPKAETGETHETAPWAISIDAGGELYLDGKRLSRDELRTRVRQRSSEREASALIAADGGAAHRAVVAVIDLLRGEGITRFAINVAPADLEP